MFDKWKRKKQEKPAADPIQGSIVISGEEREYDKVFRKQEDSG